MKFEKQFKKLSFGFESRKVAGMAPKKAADTDKNKIKNENETEIKNSAENTENITLNKEAL